MPTRRISCARATTVLGWSASSPRSRSYIPTVGITCGNVPAWPASRADRGWRALQVEGALPLDVVGVLAALTAPLAAAAVPLFAISTFDTDILLVKSEHLARAIAALRTRFTVAETT